MLDADIRQMLDQEYSETLKAVALADSGSDQDKWRLQKLAELHKQRMNEEQADRERYIQSMELSVKQTQSAKELELKERQLKGDRFDRTAKVVLDGAAIVVPCAISSYWMGKGLKFEETGSFTSRVGNWVSSHLRLFKK